MTKHKLGKNAGKLNENARLNVQKMEQGSMITQEQINDAYVEGTIDQKKEMR